LSAVFRPRKLFQYIDVTERLESLRKLRSPYSLFGNLISFYGNIVTLLGVYNTSRRIALSLFRLYQDNLNNQ